MPVSLWVAELADVFWAGGHREPFPRTLRAGLLNWQVTVKELPALTVGRASAWLARVGLGPLSGDPKLPLYGCLSACSDAAFIFLDADDPPDERRFTLAHETAHFLRDYWQIRRRAERRFGEHATEFLDGERSPGPEERLGGILAGMSLEVHTHLMGRSPEVHQAEDGADRLAFELLAPADEVLGRLQKGGREEAARLLQEEFGLPAEPAETYAARLLPGAGRLDSFITRLRRSVE